MIYEYKCKNCSAVLEIEQSIKDKPKKKCPKCKKNTLQRQISGGGFLLKGEGWYKDGYSGESNKK